MGHLDGYNADRKAETRTKRKYVISDREFFPVKKTGAVMKQILEIEAGVDQPRPDDDGLYDPAEMRAYSVAAMENVYLQVATLLTPADGTPRPGDDSNEGFAEWLEDTLDLEDARDILSLLMPSQEGSPTRTR
jgi:hypothetical protein